jgi:acetyl-CoA carboxylase biotin carboxyl carrier protein
MANEPSGSADAFDIRAIRQLVKLMNENDLAEIDIRKDSQRIRLRKRGADVMTVAAPSVPATAPSAPAPSPPSSPSRVVEKPAAHESATNYVEIKSPMLGTFYRASAPDAEPFVQVGSHVDQDTVVCIIEAMKVFNEITADCRGKIVAILGENAQAVEYGQPLFRVDTTG